MKGKNNQHLLLRLAAGAAASLLLAGGVAMTDGIGKGHSKADGLFYQASNIRSDAVVMTVDGEKVYAEEYLYWLSYYCDYYDSYLSYMGVSDWDTEISAGLSAGDFVTQQAQAQSVNMVVQRVVADQWAKEGNVTLSDADRAEIEAQRAASVAGMGGEEAYLQRLEEAGLSQDFVNDSMEHSYLVQNLYEAYCTKDGSLRPDDEVLLAGAEESHLTTAKVIVLDTTSLTEGNTGSDLRQQAEDYALRIREAEDPVAVFDEIAAELGQDAAASIIDCSAGEVLCETLSGLEEKEFSGVIDDEKNGTLYLAIRMPQDLDQIAAVMLNQEFAARCEAAEIQYRSEVFDTIDVEEFYKTLVVARAELTAAGEGESFVDGN